MSSFHNKLWASFCSIYQIEQNGLKLFDTNPNLAVNIKTHGRSPQRPVLKRHPELDQLFLKYCREIENTPEHYDGILYLMYKVHNGQIWPLYVGKTETYGKSGKVSSLIKGSNIPRWDYGDDYHIGGLSSVVMKDFPKEKIRTSYTDWAEELFINYPTKKPVLKEQVYLWIGKWETGQVGIWEDFGPTPLPMQESMLIGLCHRINDELLNTEGLTRTVKKK